MPDRRIAVFDFDGTLTRRDTLMPFLVRTCGAPAVARATARLAPGTTRARLQRVQGAVHHRDAAKAALLHALFAGREAAWLAAAGEAYAEELPSRIRPEMAARVAWHRAEGHELVIVSASMHAYLGPFARDHGYDHVIAVELEHGDDGRLTGHLRGPNVRGPEKAVRLQQWLGDHGSTFIWGYGNSSGDNELLALAHEPVWVNRRAGRDALADPPG